MADKKSKKEIPDRVGAFNKGLDSVHNKLFPNSPIRDPNKVRKSAFRVPLKDTANAMLESMFGDKEKPKAGPKGYVKKMMNGGKVMGYKDGGSVSKPKRSAPEEMAGKVGMERQEKTFSNAFKRDDDTKKKWEGRGTSGDEMAAKEYEDTMKKFYDEYDGAVSGTFRDIKNAKRYGRDAYKSRGFGQGNSDTPKDKGSQKFMNGGVVKGYKDGGEVCRGGGAATSGTKFRGVK
jgi:hypothetical protein